MLAYLDQYEDNEHWSVLSRTTIKVIHGGNIYLPCYWSIVDINPNPTRGERLEGGEIDEALLKFKLLYFFLF